jgi:hypothetical protein
MQYIEPAEYSPSPKARSKRRHSRRKRKIFGAVTISIGVLAGLFCGFLVLVAGFVFFTIKHSDAYETGRRHFASHPAVIADLGSPIRDGLVPMGSLKRVGAVGGHADLSFSLSGPKGVGQAHVVATRGATGWTLHHAEWTFNGTTTQLVTPYGAPAVPQPFPENRRCVGSGCGGATYD